MDDGVKLKIKSGFKQLFEMNSKRTIYLWEAEQQIHSIFILVINTVIVTDNYPQFAHHQSYI